MDEHLVKHIKKRANKIGFRFLKQVHFMVPLPQLVRFKPKNSQLHLTHPSLLELMPEGHPSNKQDKYVQLHYIQFHQTKELFVLKP